MEHDLGPVGGEDHFEPAPVADVGAGSPTGVAFGTGAKFPAKYQRALFVGDWSYGNVYAVHLTPIGGTYTGTVEPFLSGVPLPVTQHELRRELDYLEERGLVKLRNQNTGVWFGELTRDGIDVVEYTVECDPGIARPQKYW